MNDAQPATLGRRRVPDDGPADLCARLQQVMDGESVVAEAMQATMGADTQLAHAPGGPPA